MEPSFLSALGGYLALALILWLGVKVQDRFRR